MRGRVGVQPTHRDGFSALGAPSELFIFDPHKRGVDLHAFQFSPPRGFFRHLLTLQRINPVQAPNRLLIERHYRLLAFTGPVCFVHLSKPFQKTSFQLCYLVTHES